MIAQRLSERIGLMQPTETRGPGGVMTPGWTQAHACRAQFIYARGSEVVEAARLEGRGIFKVKIWNSSEARAITTDWRVRDLNRFVDPGHGAASPFDYAVIEVDQITDRSWIYLVVESGNAT